MESCYDDRQRSVHTDGFTFTNQCLFRSYIKILLASSFNVASGSEITPCNKIDKPLVVYRFSGNVAYIITKYNVFRTEIRFHSNLNRL